jgi:hypothetical protein
MDSNFGSPDPYEEDIRQNMTVDLNLEDSLLMAALNSSGDFGIPDPYEELLPQDENADRAWSEASASLSFRIKEELQKTSDASQDEAAHNTLEDDMEHTLSSDFPPLQSSDALHELLVYH